MQTDFKLQLELVCSGPSVLYDDYTQCGHGIVMLMSGPESDDQGHSACAYVSLSISWQSDHCDVAECITFRAAAEVQACACYATMHGMRKHLLVLTGRLICAPIIILLRLSTCCIRHQDQLHPLIHEQAL